MSLKTTLDILTAFGTIGAVIIGMHAINRNDKNAKDQIVTNKLEELLELIKTTGKYYSTLKSLNIEVLNLKNTDYTKLQTIKEYNDIRDSKLPLKEREKIFDMLSRMEVLAKCYTKNKTKDAILQYEDLIYTMTELASTTGSISQLLRWKDGFPTYEEFYDMLTKIEKKIIKKITTKK